MPQSPQPPDGLFQFVDEASLSEAEEVEHPNVVELKRWLATDGVKGFWASSISAAEFWHLDVDARHRDIAFMLRQLMGGDPSEDTIRDYLFQAHGIRPSDPVDLEKLDGLLKQDCEQLRCLVQAANAATGQASSSGNARIDTGGPPTAPSKQKRSSVKGGGRAKLVAALTSHHRYSEGSCLNLEPVGNNELARMANVAKRTASDFFAKSFHGHAKYSSLCNDAHMLAAALKALNGEFQPHEFYDARTPDEIDETDD